MQRGFTLVELVVSMVLIAAMLALLYSGLSFAVRSWDAGAAAGRGAADRRIGENFLRRELAEIFPMRWKDPMTLKFAFEGEADALRFVSTRPAGISQGGLALVGLSVEEGEERGRRNLVMRRALPDPEASDFRPLEGGEATLLLLDVDRVQFSYFGSDTDFSDPRWVDRWDETKRLPYLVRMRVTTARGDVLPDFVVRVMLGEEAGCMENAFQRGCRPRRS